MAGFAVEITKEQSFQGAAEEYSNVYTVYTNVVEDFDDVAAINSIVALEKAVHFAPVRFKSASTYGIDGPDITNVMREIVDLTGNGERTGGIIYAECAVLLQFALPRSLILRRRRIGRKWLRLGGLSTNSSSGTGSAQVGVVAGSMPLQTADITPVMTFANGLINNQHGGGTFASSGDPFTDPTVFPYLEHRQFHRGRPRR